MGKIVITREDIRRANDIVMGKIPRPTLTPEEQVLLNRVKSCIKPIKDSPQLREIYRSIIEK